MKKAFLTMLMMASCFGVANAQLMVDENGKVGIGIETSDTLKSQLSINGQSSYSTAYILSEKDYGLNVVRRNLSRSGYNHYGISSINYVASGVTNYGVVGVTNGYAGSGSTIGVFGRAGSASSGYNFGLLGRLDCSYNGAAILATTSVASRYETVDVQGKYAGYFCGDTRVTGTMTAGAFVTSSDYRLKENVRSLSNSDGCLNKLMNMNVVEFNNKQRQFRNAASRHRSFDYVDMLEEDTVNAMLDTMYESNDTLSRWYEYDSPIIKNKHYGLVAQELKEIYPDLVVESQDGYLAINYLEIIPLLIRSVQELKAELDASKNGNVPIMKAQARTTDATGIEAVVTTLYQNTPNPFTESTLIRCDIAEDVVNADLYIYDMNGKQIDTYPITERGATSITIEGRSLEAGMYLYALIADGQVIDTKRMILTK